MVKACYKNILESSTVTLSAGTENSTYPLYRLYDRGIGKMFQPAAAVTIEVKIDQGASGNLAVDRLLIPSGHNLSGMTLDILWSDNDADWYAATTQWTGAAGLIDKSWASITHRYWKFKITSPGSVPYLAELFLTQTYTFEQNPSLPTGALDDIFNVEQMETSGGGDRFIEHGNAKKQRQYTLVKIDSVQHASLTALNAVWAGKTPFFLYDHADVCIYGKLRRPLAMKLEMENEATGLYLCDFDFLEVLPA